MKIKLIFILLYVPLSILMAAEGTINIEGRVIENSDANQPVAYATVSLLREDSTLVTGAACAENGNFSLKKIEEGNYILSISYVGYQTSNINLKNLSRSTHIGTIKLNEESVSLNELTVTASAVINQVDRKLIFPSQQEIGSSANGIDLLGNMQLPGILVNPVTNSIEGVRGGSVNLRINGAPATLKEIQAINPRYVIRIEHHDEPSLRYGGAEAVIDYIVRQRESGGSVMAEARHSLDPTQESYFVNSKFNFNKSEFSFTYGYGANRNAKEYQDREEVFHFEDGSVLTRIEEGLPGKFKGQGHEAKVGYSFQETDKKLFNAFLSYSDYSQPKNNSQSLLYPKNDKASGVMMTDVFNYQAHTPSLDLYYQQKLKNKQLIAFNLVGTYSSLTQERAYRERRDNTDLTAIDTNIDADNYSIVGEAIYEKTYDAGRLSAGVNYRHSFADLTYTGSTEDKVKNQQNITYAYAEWTGKINKFTYGGGLGVTQTGTYQNGKNHNEVRFTPSLLLSYDIKRDMQIRLRTETATIEAPMSELYDVDQQVDSLQIRRGNPLLKSQMTYITRFSYTYNIKAVRISANVQHRYTSDPIMRTTVREEDKFVIFTDNQRKWHQVRSSLTLNVKLFKNYLSWMGDLGYNWIESTGNDYNHLMRNLYVITSLRGNYKSWNSFFQIENRRNHMTNEAIYYGRNMITAGIGYRYKELMVRGMYSTHFGENWTGGRESYNKYIQSTVRYYSPESKNLFMVAASWNFDFGRKYRSANKKINNAGSGGGLMDTAR